MSIVRYFIPYLIRWDANKDYYVVTRDYEYMGTNSRSSPVGFEQVDQCYLFNDETKPWASVENFLKVRAAFYSKVATLSNCLNPCPGMETLFGMGTCKCGPIQLYELFIDWATHLGIRFVNVNDQILWRDDNSRWTLIETFKSPYMTRVNRILLHTHIPQNNSWFTEPRWPIDASTPLPQFSVWPLSSQVHSFISERTFYSRLRTRIFKKIPWRFYNSEGTWFFRSADHVYYMFGDMYGDPRTDQGLVNFLHDHDVYQYTQFYEWLEPRADPKIRGITLNFHRSHVWVTRLP
jgi:hypothetical protein